MYERYEGKFIGILLINYFPDYFIFIYVIKWLNVKKFTFTKYRGSILQNDLIILVNHKYRARQEVVP